MSAINQSILANDPVFIKRIRIIGAKSAVAVSNEAYGGTGQPTAAQHNKRIAYANAYLMDSERYAIQMAWGVASNPVITEDSADGDIEYTINSIWDAYAGVVPAVQE